MKWGKRLEIYDFVTHRTRFYCIIKRKPKLHVLILGGGSCNLQLCFRGGSVLFAPNGGGGPCVFYQPHLQMLWPTHPILFDQSLYAYILSSQWLFIFPLLICGFLQDPNTAVRSKAEPINKIKLHKSKVSLHVPSFVVFMSAVLKDF